MMIEWDDKVIKKLDNESPIFKEIAKADFTRKLSGTTELWKGTCREGTKQTGRPGYNKYRKVELRNTVRGANVLIVLQLNQDGETHVVFSVNNKLHVKTKYFREIVNIIDEADKVFKELIK